MDNMTRIHRVMMGFAMVVMAGLVFAQPSDAADRTVAPLVIAAGQSAVQCAVDCIKRYGPDNAATCKYQCAASKDQTKPAGGDCMGIFKSCRRNCANDKTCVKSCKSALMQCK